MFPTRFINVFSLNKEFSEDTIDKFLPQKALQDEDGDDEMNDDYKVKETSQIPYYPNETN